MSAVIPLGWQFSGACNSVDPETFFPQPSNPGQLARAKAICARCDVIEQCRSYALALHIDFGVWGGLSEGERRRLDTGRRRVHNALDPAELEHGTRSAAQWEHRHGVPICDACKAGELARFKEMMRSRRRRAQAEEMAG